MCPMVVKNQATPRLQLFGPRVAVHLNREERRKVVLPRPLEPRRQRAERRSHVPDFCRERRVGDHAPTALEDHAYKSLRPPILTRRSVPVVRFSQCLLTKTSGIQRTRTTSCRQVSLYHSIYGCTVTMIRPSSCLHCMRQTILDLASVPRHNTVPIEFSVQPLH